MEVVKQADELLKKTDELLERKHQTDEHYPGDVNRERVTLNKDLPRRT